MSDATHPGWADADQHLPQGSLRRIALASLAVIVVGFGGLVLWAALAKVESAVPAGGVVVSGGKRKTVSLLESGILRTLLVKEGDRVEAGQLLLRLDDAQTRVTRSQARVLYWSAIARAARLQAESLDGRTLAFPEPLRREAAGDPDIKAAMDGEAHQFASRWTALDASVRVQERKIAQNQSQIAALRAQIGGIGTRLSLVQEELRGVDYLVDRGLAPKPRQLELRRNEAELRAQIGALGAQLTQTQQAIAQIELEIINTAEARRQDIAKDRSDTQAAQADAEQRLVAADDLLQKREVHAPEAGTVTDIRSFTPGSSIVAGQPVMDIVPDSPLLLVEGSVSPLEVEHLAPGQRVNVRLTSYKAHRVPVLTGRLTYVGADRQVDQGGQPFFLIRATLDPDALRNRPGIVLLPGMPADVLIVNGSRSVLDFLISPFTDSMGRAMNEE